MKDTAHQRVVERVIDRWNAGEQPNAAETLARQTELADDLSAVLELAYEEYRLRRSRGEMVDLAEFCARFPNCGDELREMIAVHQLLVDEHPSLLEAIQEAVVPEEPHWPSVGQEWEGLRLIGELGRGAVSRVYLAEELAAGGRRVSVKVTPCETREPTLQGPLSHANIMPLFSVRGSSDARFQIVIMPYWGRATLCDVIRYARSSGKKRSGDAIVDRVAAEHSRDPPIGGQASAGSGDRRALSFVEETLRIGIDIANALEYSHFQGVFHCDLKPANVLVSAVGRILLIDFNLAATRSDERGATGGTLPYMPPERLAAFGVYHQTPDAAPRISPVASDVFSLAALLYEILTGQPPYGEPDRSLPVSEQALGLLNRQLAGLPALVDPPTSNLERRLFELLRECLDCRLERRLTDAAEFARRAEEILRDETSPSAPVSSPADNLAVNRGTSRQRWLGLTCLTLLAVLFARQILLTTGPQPMTRETLARPWNLIRAPLAQLRAWMAPEDSRGWALRGDSYLALGQPQVALACYDRAKRMGYDEAALHNNIGLADMLLRRYQSAEVALTEALRRDPQLKEAYSNRSEFSGESHPCPFPWNP